MKKTLTILTAILFITITAKGQNLFFFGENSYPCTKKIPLQSNSNSSELNVLFAKDGTTPLIVVKISTMFEVFFSGKLIIYLDDGSVITCTDRGKRDYVDYVAMAIYNLTNEQLSKMKNSNINTVRYELKPGPGNPDIGTGNFSASNKGRSTKTNFPALITEFFEGKILVDSTENTGNGTKNEEPRKIHEINSRTKGAFSNSGSASSGWAGHSDENKGQGHTFPGSNHGDYNAGTYGLGGSSSGMSYNLSGRSAKSLPSPRYPGNDEGLVVVKVTVDKYGNVTAAEPGVRGTTITNHQFWNEAKQAALKAKFNVDENAPKFQQGTISYRFVLD